VRAQQDLEAARAGTDKAEAVAKKAADEAKALRDKLDAQVKSASEAAKTMQDRMDAEVKKATQTATTDARKKLDDLSAQLASTRDELTRRDAERADAVKKAEAEKADSLRKAEAAFAAKLEEQKEFYRRRVEEAQSGVLAPLAMADSSARDRASQEFDTGARLLLTQRYAEAETWLERATRGNASDARYWYYLGLAQALQNKPAYAESIKKGAELETRNQPGRRALNDALEPLPGSYRQWLSRFRP